MMQPSVVPLWRTNDQLAQKQGGRRTVYWCKKEDGKLVTACQYLGEWNDNLKEGKGTQVWKNGNKYVGGWEGGMRTGVGTYWVKEGRVLRKQYAGQWLNNLQHGRGVFNYKNGDMYDGEWKNGVRHGVGIMTYANGDVYEGEWFNDKRHGFGIYDYVGGDHFEGRWVEDKKEGEGVHFYYSKEKKTHHKRYDGEWVDDIPKCGYYTEMEPDVEVPASDMPEPLPRLGVINPDRVIAKELGAIREARSHHRAQRVPLDEHFTPEELEALQVAFSRVDVEGKGVVAYTELLEAFGHVGMEPTAQEIESMLQHLKKARQFCNI